MEEETYFVDSTIKVTSDWVKLGGKSYSVADIASVRMRSLQADTLRELPTFLVIAGSILMFALLNLHYVFPVGWEQVVQLGAIVGMLLSIAGLVMLVLSLLLKTECIYVVQLKGTFGNACPFGSSDPTYVRAVVDAIRQALDEQRSGVAYARQSLGETTLNTSH